MTRFSFFRRSGLALVVTASALCSVQAVADSYVDEANKPFAAIPPERRSDAILLPALGAMQPIPKSLADPADSMLILPGMSGWKDLEAWATAPTQVAAIEALAKAVTSADPRNPMAFAQPYGVEGVPIELVKLNLFTELGDPPMLAGARFMYLDAINTLATLVHVEATRRVTTGDPFGAINVLADLGLLGRQLADRQFSTEVRRGAGMMINAVSRMRDVAYIDFMGKRVLGGGEALAKLPDLVTRLEEARGLANLGRVRFPIGDRIGAAQAIAKVYLDRSGVNPATFVTMMASLNSTERPLMLFGEAPRWQARAATQAPQLEASEQLTKVYGDWEARWRLEPFDKRMEQPFAYNLLDRSRFAVISGTIDDLSWLFYHRHVLRTEIAGTRTAFALLAFYYTNQAFAPTLSAVRPIFVKELPLDPLHPSNTKGIGGQFPLEYFVPIRDQARRPNDEPKPHAMDVFVNGQNFSLSLRDDQFVLYSVGGDGIKNLAVRIQNDFGTSPGADYLMWPPIISLERQYRVDAGLLK